MRLLAALFLFVHGFAHLPGFAGAWRLSSSVPYHTTLLGGRLDVGDAGMRVMGVLWLAAALLFAVTAGGIYFGADWWRVLLVVAAVGSLVVSILEWPAARIGVAIDIAILVAFALMTHRAGTLSPAP